MWGVTDHPEPCYDRKHTNSSNFTRCVPHSKHKATIRLSREKRGLALLLRPQCCTKMFRTAQFSFSCKDQRPNGPASLEITLKPREERKMQRNVVPQERLWNIESSSSHYQARVYLHHQRSHLPSKSSSSMSQLDTGELRQGRRRVGKEYIYVEQIKQHHQEMVPTQRKARQTTKLPPIQEGATEAAVSLQRQ